MRNLILLFTFGCSSLLLLAQANYSIHSSPHLSAIQTTLVQGHYLDARTQIDRLTFSPTDSLFLEWKLLQAKINNQLGYFSLATEQVDSVIQLTSSIDNLYWDGVLTKAEIHTSIGDFAVADSLFLITEEKISQQQLPQRWKLRAGNSRGWWALSKRDFSTAKVLLEQHKSYQDSLNIPNSAAYLLTVKHLADLALWLGEVETTEFYLKLGEDIAKKYDLLQHIYYGKLHEIGGYLFFDLEEYFTSIKHRLVVDSIYLHSYGELNDVYQYNLTNLGVTYSYLEDFPNAEKRLLQALKRDEKILTELDTIFCQRLHNTARMYVKAGDIERAYELQQRAEQLWHQCGGSESEMYGTICELLGGIYLKRQEYELASIFLEKSEQIFSKLGNWKRLIRSYNILGELQFEKGNTPQAKKYGEQALQVYHRQLSKFTIELADSYQLLGQISMRNNAYFSALHHFYNARKIQRKLIGTKSLAFAYSESLCAQALEKLNEPAMTVNTVYQRANRILIKQLNYIFPTLNEGARIQFIQKLEKITKPYFNFVQQQYIYHPSLATDLQNLKLATDGLGLESSRNLILSANKASDTNTIYHQWLASRQKLRKAYVLSSLEQHKNNININQLQQEIQLLEKKLGWKSETLVRKNLNYQWIAQQLSTDALALDFFSYELENEVIYSVLISHHALAHPVLVKLTNEKILDRYLGQMIQSNGNNYLNNQQYNEELYQLLIKPLEKYLHKVKKIHIVPTGLLHRLSFATLQYRGKPMGEKFTLTYHQNLQEIRPIVKSKRIYQDIVLLGGADYDADFTELLINDSDSLSFNLEKNVEEKGLNITRSEIIDSLRNAAYFSYLSGTKTEVEQIVHICEERFQQTCLFTGLAALEDTLKKFTGINAPQVLHLATHGFFFSPLDIGAVETKNLRERLLITKNPLLRSGLVFTGAHQAWVAGKNFQNQEDGILTAFEVYELNLEQTELVVLSACETAQGDIVRNEGVLGLQRAFKLAGVDQLLVSLWQVPDQATSQLMQSFYKFYLKGLTPAQALQKAQRKLNQEYTAYDWGAFVVIE